MSVGGSDVDPEELIHSRKLPDPEWNEFFERIYVDEEIKEKLVNYGLLLETFDQVGLDQMTLSYHGTVLLYGPPGTGKTSLAKGVGNQVAEQLDDEVVFRQIDVEQMFSGRLGDTPKAVSGVFDLLIESANADTKQVVLLDEVESLISDRGGIVGETDPMDVARAVNVALEKLDELAQYSNIYLIATSNLPSAVDSAFFDRADVHFRIGNPSAEHRREILVDVFDNMNESFGTSLPTQGKSLEDLVEVSDGFSGRRIRKVVLESLAADAGSISDPSQLDYEQLYRTFSETRNRLITQEADSATETDLMNSESSTEGSPKAKKSHAPDSVDKSNAEEESSSSRRNDHSEEQDPRDSEREDVEDSDDASSSEGTSKDTVLRREVAFDNLEGRPEEKLLSRVATFFDGILEEVGSEKRVESLLLSDPLLNGATVATSRETLQQITLESAEERVVVDVEYDLGGGEEIPLPLPDVVESFSGGGDLHIEFVVDERVGDLDRIANATTAEAPAEITVRHEN